MKRTISVLRVLKRIVKYIIEQKMSVRNVSISIISVMESV